MPAVRRMKAKLVLMGESGVGKTSLIRRFVLNEYSETYLRTVGTRVSKIELTVPFGGDLDIQMDMSIFDILGQRGFREMVRETFFHAAQAILAVCDITRRESLLALNDWIPAALEISGEVPIYIAANKKDLEDRRSMTGDDIRKLAEPFGAPFVLTSAKTGESVEEAFNALAIEIVDRAMQDERSRGVERGLREKILVLLEKRGKLGLSKAQFLEILRGVNFDELSQELNRLEGDGLLTLAWHGAADFTAQITSRGLAANRREAPFEEG